MKDGLTTEEFRDRIGTSFLKAMDQGEKPSVYFERLFQYFNSEFKFYSWQRRFFDEAFDMNKKEKRIAIAAGNSAGKTYCTCLYLVASLLVSGRFGPMKARITTPTGQAAQSSVMENIRRIIRDFGIDKYIPDTKITQISWSDDPRGLIAQIYVMAIPISEARFDSIRGLHLNGGNLIMLYDECSRFPDGMWTENEGNMANPGKGHVSWIAVSNPRESRGGFVRCFYSWKNVWTTFQVDMEEVNRDTNGGFEQHIRNAKITYGGEDTPAYRCYIKSEFTITDSMNIFNVGELMALSERSIDSLASAHETSMMGVDVSTGTSRADSAICIRKHESVVYWESSKLPIQELVKWIYDNYRKYNVRTVAIDACGYGQAIYEMFVTKLQEEGRHDARNFVIPFYTSGRPENPSLYANRRAEVMARLIEWIGTRPKVEFHPEVLTALCDIEEVLDSEKKDFKAKQKIHGTQRAKDMIDALLYSFATDHNHSHLLQKPKFKRNIPKIRRFSY